MKNDLNFVPKSPKYTIIQSNIRIEKDKKSLYQGK